MMLPNCRGSPWEKHFLRLLLIVAWIALVLGLYLARH